jgi:hypothetical protein
MTEPRTPEEQADQLSNSTPDPALPAADGPIAPESATPWAPTPAASSPSPSPSSGDAAASTPDHPTQAWPSLAGPPASDEGTVPGVTTSAPTELSPADDAASPYLPAERLPASRVGAVSDVPRAASAGSRSKLRWGLALVAILVVAAGSLAIVSLVGGRPSTSPGMGYMPPTTFSYNEVRLDLPGDQRQKLAAFLQAFPGFKDQSAIEPKIDEVFDRLVRAASKDKQSWTTDIKPWFGGQISIGMGLPSTIDPSSVGMSDATNGLLAITIVDRAKAIAWLTKTAEGVELDRTTYGDADLLSSKAAAGGWSIAVNDKVMLAGSTASVKAAVDSAGKSTFGDTPEIKAAVATLDRDFVVFGVTRLRAYAEGALKLADKASPGALDKTQVDETVLALIPEWQATTARFENDAIVGTTNGPSWNIGVAAANRKSDLVGHVPAKSMVYLDSHDVGPALTAALAKFRGLPEAKDVFAQLDQVLSLLGGEDAVYGWWGDTALVVTPLTDGTIGGGVVIHPKDAAKAERLFTTLSGFIALGGSSAGVTSRTEDHNGTKITIIDVSAAAGMSGLPAGYKPEFAWASNADVAVIGYGAQFVREVLDAGPGSSLADDARFKGFLDRVGAENVGVGFVDVAAIRALVEPLIQAQAPADAWTRYTTDVQPYLKPLDALISNVRVDGTLNRSTSVFTVH